MINKRNLQMVVILTIVLLFCGCGSISKQKKIYDNDEKISQEGDSYSYINRTGGQDTLNKDDINQIKFNGFYGTDTLWRIEVNNSCEINFIYNSHIKKGKFKVVLITPEKEVIAIVEGTEENNKTIKVDKGQYILKIVGNNANGNILLEIEKNENITLQKNK